MISQKLLTYSLLSDIYIKHHSDIESLYAPIIIRALSSIQNKLNIENLKPLQTEILDKYGIKIDIFVIKNLLKKIDENYITISDGFIELNRYKSKSIIERAQEASRNFQKNINTLYFKFKEYYNENSIEKVEIDYVEELIDAFLNKHGLTLLDNVSVKSNFHISEGSNKFKILANFIEQNNELSQTFCNIYIGKVLSEILIIKNVEVNKDNCWDNCNVYIDTPILIHLLDIGDDNLNLPYKEILALLKKNNFNILTLEHIIKELKSIFVSAFNNIDNHGMECKDPNYVTSYFLNNPNKKGLLINLKENTEIIIEEELKIKIIKFDINQHKDTNIDHQVLYNEIVSAYNQKNKQDLIKEESIWNDVSSVNAIHCIRGNRNPEYFSDVTDFLLTNNWGLVNAIKSYSKKNKHQNLGKTVYIDSYISGVLWAVTSKGNLTTFYKNRLVSECRTMLNAGGDILVEYNKTLKMYSDSKVIDKIDLEAFRANQHMKHYMIKHNLFDSKSMYNSFEDAIEYSKNKYIGPLQKEYDKLNHNLSKTSSNLVITENNLTDAKKKIETYETKIKENEDKYEYIIQDRASELHKRERTKNILMKFVFQKHIIIDTILLIVMSFLSNIGPSIIHDLSSKGDFIVTKIIYIATFSFLFLVLVCLQYRGKNFVKYQVIYNNDKKQTIDSYIERVKNKINNESKNTPE